MTSTRELNRVKVARLIATMGELPIEAQTQNTFEIAALNLAYVKLEVDRLRKLNTPDIQAVADMERAVGNMLADVRKIIERIDNNEREN